jgi:hypothetical protein
MPGKTDSALTLCFDTVFSKNALAIGHLPGIFWTNRKVTDHSPLAVKRRRSMMCPVCKNHEHTDINLRSEGFREGISECRICGSIWSVSHGMTEVVRDTQARSFLEALTESVEGDDYHLLVA